MAAARIGKQFDDTRTQIMGAKGYAFAELFPTFQFRMSGIALSCMYAWISSITPESLGVSCIS